MLTTRALELHVVTQESRGVEDVVHEPRHMRQLAPEDGDLLLAVAATAKADAVNGRDHGRERIAQLVPHDREKLLVSPLGLLGLRQAQPLGVRRPSRCEVLRDLGEADKTALRVPERCDRDIRPETGAVLSKPPALLLEAALARSQGQLGLALA